MNIIIITGMPGSGKSEVAEQFRKAGYKIFVMGDVIRKEVKKRGMDATPENTKKVMLELRATEGPSVVADMCIEQIKSIKQDTIVIEGCRSISELYRFQDFADDVSTVAVHSSPRTRYNRLKSRNRKDDSNEWEVFKERDLREISVGIGGVIALSQHMIVNEGSIAQLRKRSQKITEFVR